MQPIKKGINALLVTKDVQIVKTINPVQNVQMDIFPMKIPALKIVLSDISITCKTIVVPNARNIVTFAKIISITAPNAKRGKI